MNSNQAYFLINYFCLFSAKNMYVIKKHFGVHLFFCFYRNEIYIFIFVKYMWLLLLLLFHLCIKFCSFIGSDTSLNPNLNFVIYIPTREQTPLRIYDTYGKKCHYYCLKF